MHTMIQNHHPTLPDRRRLLMGAASFAAGCMAAPTASWSQTPSKPVVIADMHAHLGLHDRQKFPGDLAAEMRANSATLVSWTLSNDAPWLVVTPTGIEQRAVPTSAELLAYFEKRFGEMAAYAQRSQLSVVKTVADVDRAIAGQPSVVFASEGADFLGGQVSALGKAFDMGLRHLQLVHYIRSLVGDHSTEAPMHGGLSAMGRELIQACEQMGILVDLAHCSDAALTQALQVTKKPMVWSHGWVEGDGGSYQDRYGFLKRRLSVAQARKIRDRGGVIGLWGLGLDRPGLGWSVSRRDPQGYGRELAKLINLLGPDAVALGTDISGVGDNWSVGSYADVRKVIEFLEMQKLDAATIEKVASLNFARVLKATLPTT
ncbi:MAG: membrane dipeptidase [Pseudomonadota bacterium]